jgi:hypothetical protein
MTEKRKLYVLLALLVLSLALAWFVSSSYGQAASNALQ